MAAKYKVAIIGTGRMGGLIEDEIPSNAYSSPYGHFSSYASIDETEVVAAANRGEERLQRFSKRFGVSNTYLDYREMIEKEQPDIVSVTTAIRPPGRPDHIRRRARREGHLRGEGSVRVPRGGGQRQGCRHVQRRRLQLGRHAAAPRRVRAHGSGHRRRRHRRTPIRRSCLPTPTSSSTTRT